MVKTAGIYARISDDRTGDAAGVGRQEADCRTLAAARGWTVADVFVDNDVSASSYGRKARPEYERLLKAMREKAVDAVIVWHEDRLHRQPRELEGFIDLANANGIALATVTGDIDLGTPEGRLRARMLGSVGAYESEHKAQRILRKHLQLAADGKVSGGGTRPFGFEKDRTTINRAEAAIIRKAVDAVIVGRPIRSIARDWAALGVKSPTGREFGPNAVRRLLRSGRIAGLREHHGEIVGTAVWPAVVTPEKAATVRAILSDPARMNRRAARKYLLAGYLTCGLCGAVLRSAPRGGGVSAYRCKAGPGAKGCGRIGVLAGPLEELIAEQVFRRIDSPELVTALSATHRSADASLYESIAEDEAMLSTLADDFAAKRVTRGEWLRARDAVQRRVEAARRRLGSQNSTAALAPYGATGRLRADWGRMDLDQRRAVIGALIERVVISSSASKGAPADAAGRRMFDPRRVRVEWRF